MLDEDLDVIQARVDGEADARKYDPVKEYLQDELFEAQKECSTLRSIVINLRAEIILLKGKLERAKWRREPEIDNSGEYHLFEMEMASGDRPVCFIGRWDRGKVRDPQGQVWAWHGEDQYIPLTELLAAIEPAGELGG